MTPLLLAIPLIAAAPVPKDFKPAKTDAEAVLGTWEIVVSNHHDKPNAGSVGIKYKFRDDGTCLIIHQNNTEHGPAKYSFDAKGTPKTYMWVCPWGTWRGVYELDGDTLRIAAVSQNGGALPPSAQPGKNVEYSELKRIKD